MHRFLTAFLCLSTLAMTQNVVAGTSSRLDALDARAIARSAAAGAAGGEGVVPGRIGGEVPTPATTMLLVTGLAGLSAVGGRRRAAKPLAGR